MIKRHKHKSTRRKLRTRSKVGGTTDRPRLTVNRTNQQIYAQVIDDQKQITLAAANSLQLKTKFKTKLEQAKAVGELVAKNALSKKITKVVFDRGQYKYHGRVKTLADAARSKGLKF
ncbi:50S ribosomal protein L18 [Patescibacteria group bacterium]